MSKNRREAANPRAAPDGNRALRVRRAVSYQGVGRHSNRDLAYLPPSKSHKKETNHAQVQRMEDLTNHTAGRDSFPARGGTGLGTLLLYQGAVALVMVASLSCSSHRTSVIQQQRSPDGRFIAYLESVEIEGGVDYTSRVVIAASNEPFDKDESGTWIYQASDAASPKSIAWGDNQHLNVVLSRSTDRHLANIETRERDGVTANVIFAD